MSQRAKHPESFCGFVTCIYDALVLDNCCANQSCIIQYTRTCTGTFNKAGDTPLSLDCANGHLDTEPVNMAGDTLLSLAYERGHFEMVKYLAITPHCDTKSKSNV